MATRTTVLCLLIGAGLILPAVCSAQQFDPRQALKSVLTGDESRDRLIIQGYQRGYQFGVEDGKREAQRQCKAQSDKLTAECKK